LWRPVNLLRVRHRVEMGANLDVQVVIASSFRSVSTYPLEFPGYRLLLRKPFF
jgi:hypothetical protein